MTTQNENSAPLAATNDAPMSTTTQHTQSSTIGKLAFALAKAQGEMTAAKKDSASFRRRESTETRFASKRRSRILAASGFVPRIRSRLKSAIRRDTAAR
jgi:hypothetical protein